MSIGQREWARLMAKMKSSADAIHGEPTPEADVWETLEKMEGVVDHLDTPTCGCPKCKPPESKEADVVERLEAEILETDLFLAGRAEYVDVDPVVKKWMEARTLFRDALTAIHDLQAERDELLDRLTDAHGDLREVRAENERLREALGRLSLWRAVDGSNYLVNTEDSQSKEIRDRIKVARQALTGEQKDED